MFKNLGKLVSSAKFYIDKKIYGLRENDIRDWFGIILMFVAVSFIAYYLGCIIYF